MKEKFYEKFNRKSNIADSVNKRKEFNKERNDYFAEQRKAKKAPVNQESFAKSDKSDVKFISAQKMFDFEKLPKDAQSVLENFDQIVQGVRPLNSKQIVKLPKDINFLSHQLTDERENRRMGYMNANEELSAYVRYFTWWNLVRLTRVFSNFSKDAFNLKDGDYCLDIGSGPLTVVIALWLSRPELRNKKLSFYCMDLSQATLSLGEDIYMSIAAKCPPSDENANPHWNIIRVKGGIGTSIKNKAALVTAANMFNEIRENLNQKPDELAEKQLQVLTGYATEKASFFIAEPGMPVAANFLSLLRGRLLKSGFTVSEPCPHAGRCAMSGEHARYGGSAKWCNFSFATEKAPAKLLKLSKDANLPKERAVISFIFADNFEKVENKNISGELLIRIASDPIRLPGNRFGYYACCEKGLALIVNNSHKRIENGDKIKVSMLNNMDTLERDKKSGAIIINI